MIKTFHLIWKRRNSKRSFNRKNGALINSDVRDSEKNQNDQTRGGGRAADADQID